MTNKRWKPVTGFEDLYEVSSDGFVRSLRRSATLAAHPVNKVGHLQVSLCRNGEQYSRYVHRLVLEAFVGPCPPGIKCRHLNGNPKDNRLENLAWGTASEDNYDRIRHGTHQYSKKDICKCGRPYDRVKLRPDGTVRQRVCRTCTREWNRATKKKRQADTCPQGHPFDKVRVRHFKDGTTVQQRYCSVCTGEQLSRGRRNR